MTNPKPTDGPARGSFTVVIPFYDEVVYLPATLRCLAAQTRPPEWIVLVDNGSTDGSAAVCHREGRRLGIDNIVLVEESTPGKIHALERGAAEVRTEFVAFWDADTYYPPHYLALCKALFDEAGSDVVAVMALDLRRAPGTLRSTVRRHLYVSLSRLLRRQALTGGFGQTFRAEAFRRSGGYSIRHWSHVLLDHEVMHRMFRQGRSLYHPDLWCMPSSRRRDRRAVRWTLPERLLYHLTTYGLKDWYFYGFLGPRFERRGMSHLRLRERDWR